jgi:polar amino acid transport system substrate-binding protein
MKKLLLKLLLISICVTPSKFAFSASCTADDKTPVKIVGPSFFPPIGWHSEKKEWVSEGGGHWKIERQPQGFFVDFMTELLKDNGVTQKPEFLFVGNLDEALEYTEMGNADIIFGIPHLSDPLLGVQTVFPSVLPSPIVAIVPRDKELKITRREDLIGIRGLASTTDQFGESFPEYIRKNLTVKLVPSLKEAYGKLLDGKYTYVMASYYYGHAEAVRLGIRNKLKFIPIPLTDIYLFMAVSKKSECMKQIPNFTRLLKHKYTEQDSPDKGVRKIIRNSMFEWEEKHGLYRYDPEYQTQADIEVDADMTEKERRKYKEKWGIVTYEEGMTEEEKKALDEKEKRDRRRKWSEIWGAKWGIQGKDKEEDEKNENTETEESDPSEYTHGEDE